MKSHTSVLVINKITKASTFLTTVFLVGFQTVFVTVLFTKTTLLERSINLKAKRWFRIVVNVIETFVLQ